jgi:hypothetical protein
MAKVPAFNAVDKQNLLKACGNFRNELTKVQVSLNKSISPTCNEIQKQIDELAFILTGDRKYFHEKAHAAKYDLPKG